MNQPSDVKSGRHEPVDALRGAMKPAYEFRVEQVSRFEVLRTTLQDVLADSAEEEPVRARLRQALEPLHLRILQYQRSIPTFDPLLLGHLREMEIEGSLTGDSSNAVDQRLSRCMKDFFATNQTMLQALHLLSEFHSQVVGEVEIGLRKVGQLLEEGEELAALGGRSEDRPQAQHSQSDRPSLPG